METPRSRWSVVPPIFVLALVQQVLFFLITSGFWPTPNGAQRNWGIVAVFVLGSTLLNTGFYSATWIGILGADKVAQRFSRVYKGGIVAALIFSVLSAVLTAQVDSKGPFGSYAQMFILVFTLATAFKLDDAQGALAPIENDPLKRDK